MDRRWVASVTLLLLGLYAAASAADARQSERRNAERSLRPAVLQRNRRTRQGRGQAGGVHDAARRGRAAAALPVNCSAVELQLLLAGRSGTNRRGASEDGSQVHPRFHRRLG